ncbi:MAG: hypothetical protein JWL72_1641 [Ilumatobacteraceae bacterium]|nr:hypothetical protein [Ilumatobacteraceae bacterium]
MDQHRLERLLAALHDPILTHPVAERICVVCAQAVARDGAGVSRIFRGRHEMVAASSPASADVESLQIAFAEGPCLEVVGTARPFHEPDLTSDRARRRWPHFAPAAAAQGVFAAFAFPLTTGGVTIGALDVYSTSRGDLDSDQVNDAMLLADLAALTVDRLGTAVRDVSGAAAEADAVDEWAYPSIVHSASGMISEQLDITVEEALLRLRAVAFAIDRKVTDISRDVLDHRFRLESWVADE